MLEIKNLWVRGGGVDILKGIDLSAKAGEVHTIMGPNGSGKSTLTKVIAGHPDYQVSQGEVLFEINKKPKNILKMETDERAREGIFLSFQYPIEIPGVNNVDFLQVAFDSICKHQGVDKMKDEDFRQFLKEKMKFLEMDDKFLNRFVNVDFSGGEKKRNEILQMAVLNPRLALLDETDSGLDLDALKIVGRGIDKLKSKNNIIILVTHYQRILNHIKTDFVHILYQGKIIKSGDEKLAMEIEKKGYDFFA